MTSTQYYASFVNYFSHSNFLQRDKRAADFYRSGANHIYSQKFKRNKRPRGLYADDFFKFSGIYWFLWEE